MTQNSDLTINTAETEISNGPHCLESGYLYIYNRDGSEREPFHITGDVVFGW